MSTNTLQKTVDKELAEIGERLRFFREEERDMPVREFAEPLDIDHSTWAKIERGERKITTEQLMKLYHVYNMSITWAMHGYGDMYASAAPPPAISGAVKEFINTWLKENKQIKAIQRSEAKELLYEIELWEKKRRR